MGSRRRYAVALLIPAPASIEVDALRRALNDRQLGRIGAHITVVPPINVRDHDLAEAMVVTERAAASVPPFDVTLGPIETFSEDSTTRFLRVDPWEPVTALRRSCWTGPFDRPEKRSFHPHVTVDIGGSPTDGPDPAVDLLAGFTTTASLDRVTLLEHDEVAHRWESYAHYPLTG